MSSIENVSNVMTAAAWDAFCDGIKSAGKTILRPETPASELDRAEGLRYLSRLTRVSLEMMLECADAEFPIFYQASNTTIKIGADNPDNIYLNATVRGDREYRLRGTRGTVPFLSFATKANRYAIDGTMASTGELDAARLEVEEDGSFSIIVSQTPHKGNWLPMAADSSMLLVRNTFLDRTREVAASMTIECIGAPPKPAPLSAKMITHSLESAAAFVRGTAEMFADWSERFKQKPNSLDHLDQEICTRAGGDPNIYYLHGYWEIKPDQALVIEVRPPDCELWNFQLNNYWMESLDYRYVPICINKHTARLSVDGSLRIVLAHENRGFRNWLDLDSHLSGTMLLRWTRAQAHPVPVCRLLPLDEVLCD
ncbi:MAG: DUF1214 domain-containing protein [Proteobacteria bacterium]|nr:DUF1214 domain-containing protein [Pseudomonadota bacterium]